MITVAFPLDVCSFRVRLMRQQHPDTRQEKVRDKEDKGEKIRDVLTDQHIKSKKKVC